MISGWRSYRIRAELPKGEWITPIVSVDCDAGLRGVVADKGWCINAASGDVYQLNLNTGVTLAHARLSGACYILAANDTEALVVRDPPELVTRVQVDQTTPVPLAGPIWKIRRAALGADRSIWLINWFGVLFRFKPDTFSSPQYINQPDGLLNNIVGVVEIGPDGGVWLGSSSEVSYLLTRD